MEWKDEFRKALLDISPNPPDVRKIVEQHIPSKLYKYGSFKSEYWKKVVYKGQIYLSPANVFNDPFDCRANFDYNKAVKKGKFRELLLKQYSTEDFEDIPKELIQKIVIEGMRKDIFVFCFSETWNSLLMWAHYANNYNGYCVEYDMTKVREHITYNLFPVLYEKDYIDITENLINYNQNTGLICNLSKAEDWYYEKEWRIIEYSYRPIYWRKALKAIYLGDNCNKKIRKEILRWGKENGKEIYSVRASNTQYKLEADRLV